MMKISSSLMSLESGRPTVALSMMSLKVTARDSNSGELYISIQREWWGECAGKPLESKDLPISE